MSAIKGSISVQRLLPYIFVFVIGLVLFIPIMSVASTDHADFGAHRKKAEALPHEVTHVSHVLYHALYRLLRYWLPTVDVVAISLIAVMVFILPLPMIIFSIFVRYSKGLISVSVILILSICLTIASPITLWTSKAMIGYINPFVYHSPTLHALRLFVIPVSLLALRTFVNTSYRNSNHRLYTLLLCASLLLLSTLAKPSYTFVLIPGCCIFAAWQTFRANRVDWIYLIFGICIPGLLMLGLLFLLSYVNNDDSSTISFGVFVYIKHWIPVWRIPIQLLLSLAFPLAVYLLFLAEAQKHLYLNFSWTVFAVGAFVTYCLYESGPRIDHGNFIWSSYISAFALLFASVLFLIQQYASSRVARLEDGHNLPSRTSLKICISFILFGSHVFCGIGYYIRYITIVGS